MIKCSLCDELKPKSEFGVNNYIYTNSWCNYCGSLKGKLTREGIDYKQNLHLFKSKEARLIRIKTNVDNYWKSKGLK